VGALTFRLERERPADGPRAGVLETGHGDLPTPAFFPVGTYGAVRGLGPDDLRAAGATGVLCNALHLHVRPGEALVEKLGGLHGFMAWDRPILTDSGGFQLHSLAHQMSSSEEGITFRSTIDGRAYAISPERAIQIQEALGADIIVTLDQFEPPEAVEGEAVARVRTLLERTLRWAERCRGAHTRRDQWLLGIVQGGGDTALRAESAARTHEIGFDGYAIGGLGLGEPDARRAELLSASLGPLPAGVPRYLMGLGRPEDLVEAVRAGVDLFDCVVPTRNARHGAAFTTEGRVSLRNAQFRGDPAALDPACDCPCCRTHSRGYLHHLLKTGEALGLRLLTVHNIAYYMKLMAEMRAVLRGEGVPRLKASIILVDGAVSIKERFEIWRTAWRRDHGLSDALDPLLQQPA
jgi:queuine tRNA-ribosyltransferase